jgi:hypothetical protein
MFKKWQQRDSERYNEGVCGRQRNILQVNKTDINVLMLFYCSTPLHVYIGLSSGGYNIQITVITELLEYLPPPQLIAKQQDSNNNNPTNISKL